MRGATNTSPSTPPTPSGGGRGAGPVAEGYESGGYSRSPKGSGITLAGGVGVGSYGSQGGAAALPVGYGRSRRSSNASVRPAAANAVKGITIEIHLWRADLLCGVMEVDSHGEKGLGGLGGRRS